LDSTSIPSLSDQVGWHNLVALIATFSLLTVFVFSAAAFVLMIFGVLKPDKATRMYLSGVFAVSAVSIFVGYIQDWLRTDPSAVVQSVTSSAERQYAGQVAAQADQGSNTRRLVVLWTQIGGEADRGKFTALKSTLSGSRFLTPGAEDVKRTIATNEIRFCNPAVASDAAELKSLLEAKHFNAFTITQLSNCSQQDEKSGNILEVWLQSGS